ncbi:hypothetical protein Vadar_031688 [Vaccinium darrowii]|uniref:Uncharacterized protein n=1 Tax=Vaccinium darrowii TaxID=229202 RepID=A0ACB7XVM3_9ERIC|nr:hypothetical protein Vadar_031688 [Vaccinium darrowii]
MDPNLYRAAMEGNIAFLLQNKDQFELQVTATNNTVLHVTVLFQDCVENLISLLNSQPSLLCRVNSRGETAFQIAARKGRTALVKALIAFAKTLGQDPESIVRITNDMLRKTNEDKDTALHEAVRGNHVSVVKLLVEEDPEFLYNPNNSSETPLYLAAERNYCKIVTKILRTCPSAAYGGPNGRTALHAAVFAGCLGCMKKLLDWKPNLTKEADFFGWTPLHCAARRNFDQCGRQLLLVDKSIAYLPDRDEMKIALHIAAGGGHVKAMEEMLNHCPDCWETVDGRGQTILHLAVFFEKTNVIKFILKKPWFDNLVNCKDVDGNTPLHLLVASSCYIPELIEHPIADEASFNKENSTPLKIACADKYRRTQNPSLKELHSIHAPWGWRNIVGEDRVWKTRWTNYQATKNKELELDLRKKADVIMVVAALIATVTFAAGFTLPGGYNSSDPEKGMAILTRKAAFKAFVMSNTIAMISSVSASFFIWIGTFYLARDKVGNRYGTGFLLVIIAIGAMMIAFVTGTYAVLANPAGHVLAIAVCVFSCFFFLIDYTFLHKMFRDFWLAGAAMEEYMYTEYVYTYA